MNTCSGLGCDCRPVGGSAESPDTEELVTRANQSLTSCCQIIQGIRPHELDDHCLVDALAVLEETTERLFGGSCIFNGEVVPLPGKAGLAIQLYSPAQEAVRNTIKNRDGSFGKGPRVVCWCQEEDSKENTMKHRDSTVKTE